MIKSKKTAIISLIIVFLTGTFCGILLERMVIHELFHKAPQKPLSLVEKFKITLELDSQQEETLKQMLSDIRMKHKELRDRQRVVYDSLRINFDENFITILDSVQQEKFAELQRQWQERHKNDN